MSVTCPPAALVDAIRELWNLRPPGPENLFTAPAFVHLRLVCERLYPAAGTKDALSFALHHALRAFGLPCGLPADKQHLALSANDAAEQLDRAFRSTHTLRTHLCPLDCADNLPRLDYGLASVRTLSASELDSLMNVPQLKRRYPSWQMDSERLASFTWLVVTEKVTLDGEAGQRAVPFLYESIDRDFGAIEPHRRRFPDVVEQALFALLLAPWEDWVQYTDVDWRAFRLPWVYTLDDDVFCQRPAPPTAETLSWEPCFYTDAYGDEVESERPTYLPLSDSAERASIFVNEGRWTEVLGAQNALIFGKPVMHFMIRAFLSDGIDEFLAHITAVEAGLGTKLDHDMKKRTRIQGGRQGSTYRVALRLAALLGDKSLTASFLRLFDVRSEFLHGRTMQAIASSERILARQLARRVALALVNTSQQELELEREVFLQRLLDASQVM